jgi:hypothetical protein
MAYELIRRRRCPPGRWGARSALAGRTLTVVGSAAGAFMFMADWFAIPAK